MQRTRSRASTRLKVSSDERNKVTNEKNKVIDKSKKVTDKKKKVINQKNIVIDGTTINQLNDDCLVNIFSFLPIVDRIRIQRVCKRWQNISKIPWSDKKSLVLFDDTWSSNLVKDHSLPLNIDGIDIDNIIGNRLFKKRNCLPGIKAVLKLCGQYVTDIKFYFFEGTTEIYKEIKKRCPNLNSLDYSGSVITHLIQIEYLTNNFHFLRHLKLGFCLPLIDYYLSKFLRNNTILKSLSLYNSRMVGYCLPSLSQTLEEFHFYQYNSQMYPEMIYYSLGRLPNLNTLSLSFSRNGTILDVDKALEALPSNSSIKKLTLINGWRQMTSLESMHWAKLKNLEYLRLKGPWIWLIGEQEIISDYCSKLSQIVVDGVIISLSALANIIAMPSLRTLILRNIDSLEDEHFFEYTEVEELGIHYCDNISMEGFIWLSRNARNLKTLKISIRQCCNDSIEVNDIKKIFKKKNLEIYIDHHCPY